MRYLRVFTALFVLTTFAVLNAACDNSGSSSSTSPTQTFTTDVLIGTVNVPVGGVLQSSANNFSVGQGGGTITVTLTSAIETLPGGTLLTTVQMGLAVGTPSGSTCVPLTNGSTTGASGVASLSGSVAAGNYCVAVSDVTGQLGPVAYAVAVNHP